MSEHDLTTDDGFAAMMREKESGTQGEAGQAFTPPPPPEVEESPNEEPTASEEDGTEEEAAPAQDDRLAALEKQLADAQAMIGRQANEIGELRQQSEEEPEQDGADDFGSVQESDWERIESLFDGHGGAGMMLNLANTNPALIDAGIAFWKAQGDPEAFLFEQRMSRIEAQNLASNPPEQEEPAPDPTLAEIRVERAQAAAERKLLAELGEEKIAAIQPHVTEALEAAPPRLQQMIAEDIQSGDPDRTFEAMQTLAALAAPLVDTDVARVAAEQRAAASREAKRGAAVASGSARTAEGGESATELPKSREEFEALEGEDRKAAAAKIMAQRILSQETSVAAGLTKGKQ
jgi:hypothetical protein